MDASPIPVSMSNDSELASRWFWSLCHGRLSGGQTFKAFPDPGNVILDDRRLFEFDGEYMLNLPRNLAGVLGKNCA
jgi:hypothetical protein